VDIASTRFISEHRLSKCTVLVSSRHQAGFEGLDNLSEGQTKNIGGTNQLKLIFILFSPG
jgi:hypothetical protein